MRLSPLMFDYFHTRFFIVRISLGRTCFKRAQTLVITPIGDSAIPSVREVTHIVFLTHISLYILDIKHREICLFPCVVWKVYKGISESNTRKYSGNFSGFTMNSLRIYDFHSAFSKHRYPNVFILWTLHISIHTALKVYNLEGSVLT